MKTFTVQLSNETAERAEKAAGELGLSLEELVEASIEEKLRHLDISFDEATQHVVEKNEELYRRLS